MKNLIYTSTCLSLTLCLTPAKATDQTDRLKRINAEHRNQIDRTLKKEMRKWKRDHLILTGATNENSSSPQKQSLHSS